MFQRNLFVPFLSGTHNRSQFSWLKTLIAKYVLFYRYWSLTFSVFCYLESSKSYKKLTATSSKELLEEQASDDTDKDSLNSEDEWDKAANQRNDIENNKKNTKKKSKSKNVKTEKNVILDNKNESSDNLVNTTNIKNSNDKIKNNTEIFEGKNSAVKTIGGELKPQLDPLKFLKSDKDAVDFIAEEEGSSDDDVIYDTDQRMYIREAFANDDVIGDFVNDKNEIIDKSKPQAVDLTLPGWGEWAGAGLKVSAKKRKRFQKDPGPSPKRKDDRIPNVIINEQRNTKLAKHQVTFFVGVAFFLLLFLFVRFFYFALYAFFFFSSDLFNSRN